MRPLSRPRALWLVASLSSLAAVLARGQGNAVELANLHEDISGLSQRVADLAGRVELLENRAPAAAPAAKLPKEAVTTAQLNEAIATLTAEIADLRATVVKGPRPAVSAEEPTVGARDGGGASGAGNPSGAALAGRRPAGFATDFPHEGVAYLVAKGDTLALIAKKTGARFADIVNANRLSDPSHIRVGQKLFLPGGKIPSP